ncbi:zinc finger and SCAN domain-containing protein 12-like [Belonocnema kinseyi]|uniref:zinc finger and SCAN domain-containing protein 12-like n=1 Tax=Belonocnema kinseyi TaxID=2817044 RepID=UPI00143DF355|nr:zinc finger and SCAN domain-containing protein 12-like [Belonocnema kinseyi]XP_033231472.1 zinc finger and SCAN domain-containing protein 12-like [Belonocnema kinseyi]XP_033231473.1 zinc finger and SCAN domain-containing protein 12-like [Belonocnema kinseyi]
MSTESIVNRSEFEEKLNEFLEKRKESNRARWTRQRLQNAKDVLLRGEAAKSNGEKVPNSYYYLIQKYELLRIGKEIHVIKRRNEKNQSFIYMVALEDYYEKLLEAHLQTSHGGRDKIMYYLKDKCEVLKEACVLFVSCCQICNRKRVTPKRLAPSKGAVNYKPTCGFNIQGQVDMIDFLSSHDGEYKWLLKYQDLGTKFIHLRPLTTNQAASVAKELSTIFFTWGAPRILQSQNGSKFVTAVLQELISLWPQFESVQGCPEDVLKASLEKSNADIQNMLNTWMIDNNSTNWSRGCYEVQWQKNTSKHIVTDKIPYEAVFGPAKISFKGATFPEQNLNGIVKQEVLETALDEQHVCSINSESDAESNKTKRKKTDLPDPIDFVSLENATSNTQEQNAQSEVQQTSASSDEQQQNTQLDAQNSLSLDICGVQDDTQPPEYPSKEEVVHLTHIIIKCEPPEYDAADQMEHFVEEQSRELLTRKNLPVKCETCGEVFSSVSGLSTHMRSHTGAKPFECDICNKKLTNDQAAKTHINDHMGKDQRFKCPMCPRDFKRYNFLRSHVQNHPKNDLYRCRICKESFATKGILQSHMITHQEKKFFSCDICKRPFMLLWQLNKHKKIHLAEKPYACDTCGKRFLTPYHLNIHVRYHTGEKPFECNICKKRFTIKRTLKRHKISHEERQCDVCKKVFTSKNALRSHNNKFHSDKRTYQCDTCGNTYLGRAGIIGHLRLHTGEHPFECDICKQKFRYKSTLNTHKKNHIENYKCPADGMDCEQAAFETVNVKVENDNNHSSADVEDGMVSIPKTIFKTDVQEKETCDPLNFNQEAEIKDIKTEMEEAIN